MEGSVEGSVVTEGSVTSEGAVVLSVGFSVDPVPSLGLVTAGDVPSSG
jgi:hypothetical protein